MTQPGRPRRGFRLWPAVVCCGLFIVVSLVVARPLSFVLGVEPAAEVSRSGVARVGTCSSSIFDLGMYSTCEVQVQWEPKRAGGPVPAPASEIVSSIEPLSGEVPVVLRGRDNAGAQRVVVPANHPVRSGIQWSLLFMAGHLLMAVLGFTIGFLVTGQWWEPRRRPRRPTQRRPRSQPRQRPRPKPKPRQAVRPPGVGLQRRY